VQFTTTRDEGKLTGVYGTGRVTVVDRNDALAHREDRDVSEALQELFDDEGIEVRTGMRVGRVEGRSGESVKLHVARDGA